jgi:protein-disulfide isomerase
MTSGRKSKQVRRTPAPPPVRAKNARRRTASPRVLGAAGGIVVAVIVAVVIVAVATGGSGTTVAALPTNGSLTNALPGARDVNSLLNGIPQRGLTLGSPKAPVTLTEYIDLQCPYCQQFETHVMPEIIKSYVRTGKVEVQARVLAFIGPDSLRGRDAMFAAATQGKAFDFAQLLYDNQGIENTGWLDDGMVAAAAKSIPGLNPKQLFSTRSSAAVTQQGNATDNEATAHNVISTPTILVNGKQVQLSSPTDTAALVRAIRNALR